MEYICLDIECTGLDKDKDEIIEIAACRFNDSEIIEEYQTFVAHKEPISEKIQNLTGISNEMTEGAPEIQEILPKLKDFIKDLPILGHNIQFDLGFLNANGAHIHNLEIDSLPLSHMLLESEDSFSLEVLCQNYNQIYSPSHRAMDDVKANIELFWILQKKLSKYNPEILSFVSNQLKNTAYQSIFENNSHNEFTNFKNPIISALEINNTNIEVQSTHIFNLPDDFKEKQFLVKNINTINDIPSEFTFIPKKLEYFNVEQIKDYLDSTQNLELDEKLTLLKVLIKYEENKILHTLNVNFRMDEMIHLNNFLEQFVNIPNHNQKPYVCDFETFFFMNHHQLLPEDHEAYLDFDPFLAEGYLNAITDTLYIPKDQESSIISILKKDGLDLEPYQKIQLDMFQIQDLKEYGLNSEFFNSTNYIYMGYKDYFNLQIVKMPKIEKITIQSIFNQIKIPHFFVIPENPNFEIKTHHKAPHFKSPNFKSNISDIIFNEISENQFQNSVIIANSKDHIRSLFQNLQTRFKEIGITLLAQDESGSKSKILSNIQTQESPIVLLCTYQFMQKFSPDFSKIDHLYITSLPFHTISHFYFDYIKKQASNEFMEVLIPECSSNLIKLSYFLSSKYNINQLTTLDDRLISQRYGKDIQNLISNYVTVS